MSKSTEKEELVERIEDLWPQHVCDEHCTDIEEYHRSFDGEEPQTYYRCKERYKELNAIADTWLKDRATILKNHINVQDKKRLNITYMIVGQDMVTEWLSRGWELYGSPVLEGNSNFARQAIIKRDVSYVIKEKTNENVCDVDTWTDVNNNMSMYDWLENRIAALNNKKDLDNDQVHNTGL